MLGQKGSLPVLERATLPSLYNRRLQDIVVLMYKVKYGLVPDNVSNLFVCKDSAQKRKDKKFSSYFASLVRGRLI